MEAIRDVLKRYHEVWSNGQVTELEKILGSDFACHFIDGIEWKGIVGANNSITVIENHFQIGRKK